MGSEERLCVKSKLMLGWSYLVCCRPHSTIDKGNTGPPSGYRNTGNKGRVVKYIEGNIIKWERAHMAERVIFVYA